MNETDFIEQLQDIEMELGKDLPAYTVSIQEYPSKEVDHALELANQKFKLKNLLNLLQDLGDDYEDFSKHLKREKDEALQAVVRSFKGYDGDSYSRFKHDQVDLNSMIEEYMSKFNVFYQVILMKEQGGYKKFTDTLLLNEIISTDLYKHFINYCI